MNPIDFSSTLKSKISELQNNKYQKNLKTFASSGVNISKIDPKLVAGLQDFQINKLIKDIKKIENLKQAYPI